MVINESVVAQMVTCVGNGYVKDNAAPQLREVFFCIAALRFKREDKNSFDHDIEHCRVPPPVQLPALMNAADAVQTNAETAEDLKLLLNEGSPVGGAHYLSTMSLLGRNLFKTQSA